MAPYFFRVEHDLLRSESFKELGGSAIKVYLIIGLHSDFGTDWAYPSIRTIAREGGLSRQTVLTAIAELTENGLLVASKSKGHSTAYKIMRQAPQRPPKIKTKRTRKTSRAGLDSLEVAPKSGLLSLEEAAESGPKTTLEMAQFVGQEGPSNRPKLKTGTKKDDDTASIPIPGTPFRLSAEGRLLVAVDLQELLTNQGISQSLAERIVAQKDPEDVAKVLLNALYLQSQGKLQNGPGYIRAGLEEGYDLLPQVVNRLESRRRELTEQLREADARRAKVREEESRGAEEAAINHVLERLHPDELVALIEKAKTLLPEPIVRRNPTLSNPFIRGKVYELACGEPLA
jgi:biotin operon repressor